MPEHPQRPGDLEPQCRLAAIARPAQRGPQVGVVRLEDGEPGLLVRPSQRPVGLTGLGKVVQGVAPADLGCLSAGFQLLQRIGTDRLQLTVTDISLGRFHHFEQLGLDEGAELVEQVREG